MLHLGGRIHGGVDGSQTVVARESKGFGTWKHLTDGLTGLVGTATFDGFLTLITGKEAVARTSLGLGGEHTVHLPRWVLHLIHDGVSEGPGELAFTGACSKDDGVGQVIMRAGLGREFELRVVHSSFLVHV